MTEEINELEILRNRVTDLEKLIKAWLEPMATMKVNALEVGTIMINDEATLSGTGLGATIAGLEKRLGEVEITADRADSNAKTADGKAVVAQKTAVAAQRSADTGIANAKTADGKAVVAQKTAVAAQRSADTAQKTGNLIKSKDGNLFLVVQNDGNCVLYKEKAKAANALWSTGTRV